MEQSIFKITNKELPPVEIVLYTEEQVKRAIELARKDNMPKIGCPFDEQFVMSVSDILEQINN